MTKKERNRISNAIYNGQRTPVYIIWMGMKQRCLNPKHRSYPDYGGRGIKICKEWMEFQKFKEWVDGSNYEEGLCIDRIKNSKPYSPTNCRFVTRAEQSVNKRNNITYRGMNASIRSRELGGSRNLVRSRLLLGWSKKDAFTKPARQAKVR